MNSHHRTYLLHLLCFLLTIFLNESPETQSRRKLPDITKIFAEALEALLNAPRVPNTPVVELDGLIFVSYPDVVVFTVIPVSIYCVPVDSIYYSSV